VTARSTPPRSGADALLPPPSAVNFDDLKPTDNATRQKFRKMLREGQFDDKEIEIEVAGGAADGSDGAPPGMEEITQQIQGMFSNMQGRRRCAR
jgi:ATP-dependent HslUV protease ATP-binding subunit HslU